jgi:hypothetical protein
MSRSASILAAALLLALTACAAPPMRAQNERTSEDAADETGCRAQAHQEAIRRLPYGNGPPVFWYPKMSMLQWTLAIDNERYYLERDLTQACLRQVRPRADRS